MFLNLNLLLSPYKQWIVCIEVALLKVRSNGARFNPKLSFEIDNLYLWYIKKQLPANFAIEKFIWLIVYQYGNTEKNDS